MASWKQIQSEAPEFASRAQQIFESGTNKTLATLRAGGAPRISAVECTFENGEVTIGMMGGSRKQEDVGRDPRAAMHSPTIEPPPPDRIADWVGDAKMAGILVGIERPAQNHVGGACFFRFDINEVALTYVGDPADHLVIESWHPEPGWRRRTRT